MSTISEDDNFIELIWKIENFSSNLYEPGEYFSTGELKLYLSTPWYLQLYPKGTSSSLSQWIGVMLRRGVSQHSNSISMKTEFSVLDTNRQPRSLKQIENQYSQGTQCGIANFVLAEDLYSNEDTLLPEGCFTLRCRIFSEGISRSQNISVSTQISVQRRSILWPIDLHNGDRSSIVVENFPKTNRFRSEQKSQITLLCGIKGQNIEWVKFSLKRYDDPLPQLLLQSHLTISVGDQLCTYVLDKKYLQKSSEEWDVKQLLNQKKILEAAKSTPNMSLKATCDFLVIDKNLRSEIQYEEQFTKKGSKNKIKDEDLQIAKKTRP